MCVIIFHKLLFKGRFMNLEKCKLNTSQVHNNGGKLYKYKNALYKLYDEFPYFIDEKERINVIGKQLSGLRASFQKQLESANR